MAFGSRTPSKRLEVQMPNRPGELAGVVRLIGIEQKINIAGMVVPPLKGGEDCVAIMHLQVDEPSAIAHALRKVGYRVGTPSLENDPDVDVVPTEEYVPTRRLDGTQQDEAGCTHGVTIHDARASGHSWR
jgi:hypothetical protein